MLLKVQDGGKVWGEADALMLKHENPMTKKNKDFMVMTAQR